MNCPDVDRIASALLYEGYLLYPYRPSVKNRQRWTFGGLYPPMYSALQPPGSADASAMQTQCLVRGSARTRLTASIRFLHLVARRIAAFDRPQERCPVDEAPATHPVESLRVGDDDIHAWQEAVERRVDLGASELGDLLSCPRWIEFSCAAHSSSEPLREPSGVYAGLLERRQHRVEGGADLSAEALGEGLFRVTARVENRTHITGDEAGDRDTALLYTLVSTHTILSVEQGEFLSLLDPPGPVRELAAACRNIGTWPVLIGRPPQADTLLSSPIILYDYPQVAPESPGDLFDATEIDEILTLRIMTLTDEEKRGVAALDGRGRALLERTEALAREQLMGLHGTFRPPGMTGPRGANHRGSLEH
jgi:hydrogenase maturation protease